MTPFAAIQSPDASLSANDLLAQEQEQLAFQSQQRQLQNDYWAAKPSKDVIAELRRKEGAYFGFADRRGFTRMWRIIYAQHYGLDPEALTAWATQTVGLDGEQGELLRFRINETRSYAKQLMTMAIGHRPSFECAATNTDYDSIGQAEAADSIIEYVYQNSYGERKEWMTVEKGTLYGIGWSWCAWDPTGGKEAMRTEPVVHQQLDGSQMQAIDERTGKPLTRRVKTGKRTGDIVIKSLAPWDVFFEPTIEEFDDHLWRCVRERRSKAELAGIYRDKAQEIRGLRSSDEYALAALFGFDLQSANTDEVIVKHFYHAGSPALDGAKTDDGIDCSSGRYIVYVGDIKLEDKVLPYPVIPLVDFCPAPYLGTALGYADVWDLCSVNQMLDQTVSDIASNLATFGRQSIWVEEGTDYTADKIANGMGVLTGRPNSKPPQAVQFASIPESSKWFTDFLRKTFQSLSQLNSVTRGDPDASITSGTMAALFHSIAIENNSPLQVAVDSHRERLANLILEILKQYAEHEMIAQIAGADERPYLDTFTRDKLSGVSGVTVKTSNPMMRTQAGRLQIAEMMMKVPGAISDPGQITEIIVSGQMKPLYDSPRKKRMQIKLENEMLQDAPAVQQVTPPPLPVIPGQLPPPVKPPYRLVPDVPVSWLDDHLAHINEHHALLTSREAMRNQPMRDAVLAHIEDHMRVWQESDPAKLTALKMPLYPQAGPPPGAPPGPPPGAPMPRMGPPGRPANDNGAPAAMQPTDQGPAATGKDMGITLPQPAKSPVPGRAGAA